MIVVSDTSPLRYLVQLDKVDILPRLYGQVFCPLEVIEECCHAQAPEALRRWTSSPPGWLLIKPAAPLQSAEFRKLDPGEAAAIALALQFRATLLLMDERKGREAAMTAGLRIAGTLAILADAAKAKILDFDRTVADLLSKTNFRVSMRVIEAVRLRLGSDR